MAKQEKVYKFYSDAGHGWLAVKKQELFDLGIQKKISPYSYVRGATVYLEEDCDASVFMEEMKKRFGKAPAIKEGKFQNRSPIRSYDAYDYEG